MEIPRILMVFLVFLMMWERTFNYKLNQENNLHKREANHESDHAQYLTRIKQVKQDKEKRNVSVKPMNPANSDPQPQSTLPALNLGNKVPTKAFIPRRKIIRIKPMNVNTNIKTITNTPYVLAVKKQNRKDNNSGEQNKINETFIDQNESDDNRLKETVLEDKELTNTMTDNSTLTSDSKPQKNLDEPQDKLKVTSGEPQDVGLKTKSKATYSKTRKSFDIINDEADSKASIASQEPDENSKKNHTDLEKTTDEIKHSEKDLSEDISVEDDLGTKSVKTEENKTQPNTYPLLKAVKNELFTNIKNSLNSSDKIEEKEDDSLELVQRSGFEHTFSQETDDSVESEGLIIKNKKYEEVVEYLRPPNVPPFDKMNTVQESINPEPYYDYQVPHLYYQEWFKPESNLNNYQNDNSYKPDQQQIEQIDGSTVVSYNNYYKKPAQTNWNYNRYKPTVQNINRYSGYVPVKPNQTVNNGWTCISRHGNQAVGDVDRIWKTWMNTEYYLKSKNALKQIGNERFPW